MTNTSEIIDTRAFEAALRAHGYTEIETKALAPSPANGEHGHDFSVHGLAGRKY